jgi:hypothetical protein
MGATFKLQDMTLSMNSRKLAESIKAKKLPFDLSLILIQLLSLSLLSDLASNTGLCFIVTIVRFAVYDYSTPKIALKLWIKHNGSPSVKITTKGCINLDDFAEKVKKKFSTHCQAGLFSFEKLVS